MISSVNVLCPNGRRTVVKISPNTTILQIIEQSCKKYGFNPEDFELKHLKRILKAESTVRFEGLPNNAQLELIPAEKKRQDEPVSLVLQLPSGTRLNGEYLPRDNLQTILDDFRNKFPEELDLTTGEDAELHFLYIRSDIRQDSFKSTTLKCLGLTGGKALIRVLRKQKDLAASLTCVGGILSKPERPLQVIPPTPGSQVTPFEPEPQTPSLDISPNLSPNEETVVSSLAPSESVERQRVVEAMEIQQEVETPAVVINVLEIVEQLVVTSEKSAEVEEEEEMDIEKDEGVVYPLGDRGALLFNRNQVSSKKIKMSSELDDAFFEVTMDDFKLMQKELVKKRKELEQEAEFSLLTSELRQRKEDSLTAQKEADRLSRLHRYPKTTLRVSFPAPDYLVLQAVFKSLETVQSVLQFVCSFLSDPEKKNLYLYSSPPKQVLDPSKRLFELDLPPGATVYISSQEEAGESRDAYWLKEDVRGKVSSFAAAARIAEEARRTDRVDRPVRCESGENASHADQAFAPPSDVLERLRRAQATAVPPSNEGVSKIPQWFKK